MVFTKEAIAGLNGAFDLWAKRIKTELTVERVLDKTSALWVSARGNTGLGAWQAEVLRRYGMDALGGLRAERGRILVELEEFFERIPEDTVLGMYGAKLKALVGGEDAEKIEEYYRVNFEYGSSSAIIVRNETVGEL